MHLYNSRKILKLNILFQQNQNLDVAVRVLGNLENCHFLGSGFFKTIDLILVSLVKSNEL